ncbi:MAG: metal ABC transporter substrate-binding protein [Dehalococcoidia bacterium]|nr:metal ABC transporter substrate-binding protein [Dehalococcoidia bacterium]
MFTTAACGSSTSDSSGRPNVVATIQPIGALARAIGGSHINLSTLLGPGVDPHDYEASPGDIKRLHNASVVFKNGLGLDAPLDKAIEGSGASRVVTVTEGVTLIRGKTESGKDEDDPHVWHDPENAKIMADNIANALAAADPANADVYRQNASAQKQRLDDADRQVRALIDTLPPDSRKMVTNHDAFGYFIQHYGLTFVGAVIPSLSTQAEASPRQIAALEDTIRSENVKAIFAESSLDPKVARQVAADTGVKIVDDLYGDSLGKPGSGADTIEGMLIANATKIVEALR